MKRGGAARKGQGREAAAAALGEEQASHGLAGWLLVRSSLLLRRRAREGIAWDSTSRGLVADGWPVFGGPGSVGRDIP